MTNNGIILNIDGCTNRAGEIDQVLIEARVATIAEARAFVEALPKALRLKANGLSGDPVNGGFISGRVAFVNKAVQGDNNEAGIARLRRIMRLPHIIRTNRYANSATEAQVLALIAK